MGSDEADPRPPPSDPQEAAATATSITATTTNQADQDPSDKADAADQDPNGKADAADNVPPFKPTALYKKQHPHCRPLVTKDDLVAHNTQCSQDGLGDTFTTALPSDLQHGEWAYVGIPESDQLRLGIVMHITKGVPTVWYSGEGVTPGAPVFEELHEASSQIMQIARVPELTLPALASRSSVDPKDYIKTWNVINKKDDEQSQQRIDYLNAVINDLITKKSYITDETVKDALNEIKRSEFTSLPLGTDKKNGEIVTRYFATASNPPKTADPTVPPPSSIVDQLSNLLDKLRDEWNTFRKDFDRDRQTQQIIHAARLKPAVQSGPKQGRVGHVPPDGNCGYTLTKMAQNMVNGVEFDKTTFSKTMAKEGKELIITGAFEYMNRLCKTPGDKDTSSPEEQFMNTIGNSAQELVTSLSGGRSLRDVNSKVNHNWAGSSEFALSTYGQPYKIVIIHADGIHSAQNDDESAQHVHDLSLLEDCAKEQVVYAILEKGHYMLGLVVNGDERKAVFNIGPETDEALQLILAHIKEHHPPPVDFKSMAQLPENERAKAIQGIVNKTRKLKPVHPKKKQKQGGDNHTNNQQNESGTQRKDLPVQQNTSPPKKKSYSDMARAQFAAKVVKHSSAVTIGTDDDSDTEEDDHAPRAPTTSPHKRSQQQKVKRRDAKYDKDGFTTSHGKRANRVSNTKAKRPPKSLGALVVYNNMEPDDLEAAIKQKDPPSHRLIKRYVQCSGHYILCANPGDVSELKDRLHALSNQKFKVKAYVPREDRLANKGKSGLKKLAKATKFCPAAIAGEKCKGCSLTGCPKRN